MNSWYNFTPNISYHTLTVDEAEEEFSRRNKTINYFAMMVKKRLENKDDEDVDQPVVAKSKAARQTSGLVCFFMLEAVNELKGIQSMIWSRCAHCLGRGNTWYGEGCLWSGVGKVHDLLFQK